jgi:SAM-dependent methyltransferase
MTAAWLRLPHDRRSSRRFGVSSVADADERGRPSYPAEALDRVLTDLELTDASRVLDLAAGTGQLSRLLRTRVDTTIAVEPAPAMRTKLAATLHDVIVLDGTAEAIPLRDHEVDAVVVGEAFHWFQTAQATDEIARVLTDGGGIALLWNSPMWTVEDTPWLDDLRRIVAHHKRAAGGYPAGDGTWQREFESTGLFEDLEHVQLSHAQALDPIVFVAQVASWSWIANLDGGHRQVILDDVHALVRGHDEIVIPYRTDLHLARRRGRAE